RVPRADSSLRDLCARFRLPLPRTTVRGAAEAVPLRRLVPATPRPDVAARGGVGAAVGRSRPRSGPIPSPGRTRPTRPLWHESHTSVTVSGTDLKVSRDPASAVEPCLYDSFT